MAVSKYWKSRFQNEIKKAREAREGGNEGMARVCARRAAGIAVGEYLDRQNQKPPTQSAYNQLKTLMGSQGTSPRVLEIAAHMLMRVTPEHSLPEKLDLIAEAEELLVILMED